MGLFSVILPQPKEVKECTQELKAILAETERSLEMHSAADMVSGRVKEAIWARRDEIVQRVRTGTETPRTAVLLVLRRVAGDLLTSGQFHVYRGVLGAQGNGLLALFQYSDSELVRAGRVKAEAASDNIERLRQAIQEVG